MSRGLTLACLKAEGKVPEVREELRTWRRKVMMEGRWFEREGGDWIKGTGGGAMTDIRYSIMYANILTETAMQEQKVHLHSKRSSLLTSKGLQQFYM